VTAENSLSFRGQGWELWDEPWLRERLRQMGDRGYENQVLWSKNSDVLKRREFLSVLSFVDNSLPQAPAA
jgi:hypothetical protein